VLGECKGAVRQTLDKTLDNPNEMRATAVAALEKISSGGLEECLLEKIQLENRICPELVQSFVQLFA
jgi:hypothetical protein